MSSNLTVWWDGVRVGTLTLNQYGEPEFSYGAHWLSQANPRAISTALPLRPDPFDRRATLPFFEGLLPEASQRTAVAQALGISERNEFRLLEALGGDVAGALEIWPDDMVPPAALNEVSSAPLADGDLVALIKRLPARPMLAGGEAGLRLSLAGAQAKLPVVLVDGKVALPSSGQPTTHILKPEIARFDGSAENEALSMTLAGKIGFEVAQVEYRAIGKTRFILIERYDRVRTSNGEIRRLHQEDFCQALGLTSAQKYAADGGPVLHDCFDLVRRATTRPAAQVLKLLDAVIFNAIIGNADAHGKNFSLLFKPGSTELAPLYDLLSTVAYPDLSQRFAMKIAKRRTLEDINAADWSKFAEDIGMRAPFVKRRVKEIAEAISSNLESTLVSLELVDDRLKIAKSYADTIKGRVALITMELM